jgi:hypothetical protein
MIYCLCGSIIFMVIIMIVFLSELGKYIDEDGNPILTNQHLRGISTISNLLYVEGIIDDRYNKIYNGVIDNAVKGKTNIDFTIMCIRNQYNVCDNYDGYQVWWRQYILRNGGELIPKNNIKSEQIKMRVIEKIQNAFPDSNITKGYKNCCDAYNITW